jgi:hypothetical protein
MSKEARKPKHYLSSPMVDARRCVIEIPPVRFRRASGMKPTPTPMKSGSVWHRSSQRPHKALVVTADSTPTNSASK